MNLVGVGTKRRVFAALSSVNPKPVAQLAEETGLSRTTIAHALRELRAQKVGTHPGLWIRPEIEAADDVVKRWRHQRFIIAERIRVLTISEGADPVRLADEFLELGKQLSGIGRQIDRVKMDPDWFQRLGGHFWLSDGEGKMQ